MTREVVLAKKKKLNSTFHPVCTFGEADGLQPAVSAHHSAGALGVWCAPVAAISTACIPFPSFHKAVTFSALLHFPAPLYGQQY